MTGNCLSRCLSLPAAQVKVGSTSSDCRKLLTVSISEASLVILLCGHDHVIKWKYFPRTGHLCGEFTGPHKGQWRGALMSSLICVGINGWVNNRETGDLRRYRVYYGAIVMVTNITFKKHQLSPRDTSVIHQHVCDAFWLLHICHCVPTYI